LPKLVKKLQSIISQLILISYIAFSLVSLQNCTKHEQDDSTSEQLSHDKAEVVKFLLQKFNAEVFDCNSQIVLEKTVVADTTLIGVFEKGSETYLNAQIKTDCSKKYFVRLKCSEEVLAQYRKTKSNNAIIAATFNRIDNAEVIANVDSLDGANPAINLGESVILSGVCYEIRETPTGLNAN